MCQFFESTQHLIMEKNIVTSEGSALCPVNSYNEWDLLEEVIVGVVDGAAFPPYHIVLEATMPPDQLPTFRANAGKPFPAEQIAMAKNELEEFVHILEGEGVKVRRPLPADQQQYGAPGWTSTGLYNAMPRDVLLVVGDDIIECPLAWRSLSLQIKRARTCRAPQRAPANSPIR